MKLASLLLRVFHTVGLAPAINSSQRGQPAVLRPNLTPPHVCLVVFDFVHAMLMLLLWLVIPIWSIRTGKLASIGFRY